MNVRHSERNQVFIFTNTRIKPTSSSVTGISNHGGSQLDGSRGSFVQLAKIAEALGIGRRRLCPLASAGQNGVERSLGLLRAEIERDMKLIRKTYIKNITVNNLTFNNIIFRSIWTW
jgi:isopentenyl diphosphate isomerase/L-lactate dehydrogenase-like FMN-dependent dehydrogenase